MGAQLASFDLSFPGPVFTSVSHEASFLFFFFAFFT